MAARLQGICFVPLDEPCRIVSNLSAHGRGPDRRSARNLQDQVGTPPGRTPTAIRDGFQAELKAAFRDPALEKQLTETQQIKLMTATAVE